MAFVARRREIEQAINLLERGDIKRLYGYGVDATLTLRTVPEGKKFYILSACLNVSHYDAGYHNGYLEVWDGANHYRFIQLYAPDAVDQMSESMAFIFLMVPAGWSVRLFADLHTYCYACAIGVEVPA